EAPPAGAGERAQRLRAHLARQVGEIADACRTWRPHLVHIEIAGVLGHAVLDLAQHAAVPVTSYWHALHRLAPSADQAALLATLHAFHRRCARTFADTPAQAADLAAAGVRDVHLIGRGVDAQHFTPAMRTPALRMAWGAGVDTPVALYVSRLLEVKNLDLLARALEAARRAQPKLIAVIVGDGPERAALAARLPWAIFTGTLTGQTLAEVYASADLFPYPGRTTSFALALLEAMASDLAPVAFAPTASLHLQDGVNGRVLADGDDAGFIAAVTTLATNLPLTRRLGAAARTTATGIGWNALGGLVAAEFRAVVAQAAAGAAINAASRAPSDPAPRDTSDAPVPPPPSSAGTGRAPGR
ncbi:MAG: glycosyltransferase, partial [Planctomycetes bacterium]|nr:glycosyltransferase [Planctomycetota bacterium]